MECDGGLFQNSRRIESQHYSTYTSDYSGENGYRTNAQFESLHFWQFQNVRTTIKELRMSIAQSYTIGALNKYQYNDRMGQSKHPRATSGNLLLHLFLAVK